MIAATMPSAASLPPSWTGAQPTSRSQRQRDRSYEEGFVDHREWLSEDDHRRAGRIHRANMLGWPAEIDEVLAEYGERLGGLSPEIIRTLYRQAKREIGGRDYLTERWLPYKRLAGTARATGHAGAGRAAPLFIRLIEELRRRGYRNWDKRGGGQRWLLDEWFEDQATLGKAIGRSRIVVNRLLADPDMQHFVVKIPRRWFDCRVSGGATRNASLRYLFAIEDPLVPDDVEAIQARLRELLDARLRDGQEEPEIDRDKAGGHDDETPSSPEYPAPEAADDPGCDTQNAVSKRYPERSITLTLQSVHSERDNTETGVRRSAREEGASSSYSRRYETPAQSSLAPRKAQGEGETTDFGRTAQQGTWKSGEEPGNGHPSIEPNRRSTHEIAPAATAELAERAAVDAQHMPLRRPAGPAGSNGMGSYAAGEHGTEAVTGGTVEPNSGLPHDPLATSHGATTIRGKIRQSARESGDADAPPPHPAPPLRANLLGIDLSGAAVEMERGRREAQVSDAVGWFAYSLALKMEMRESIYTGRTEQACEQSAGACAKSIVTLLAASTAPEEAWEGFVRWAYDRAYRSARRAATGERSHWNKPAGYLLRVAQGLVGEAKKANWDCDKQNDKEFVEARRRADVERWQAQEREKQAAHDAERAERERQRIEYVQWLQAQEQQERERERRRDLSSDTWVNALSEDDALGYVQLALSTALSTQPSVYPGARGEALP
jgi:hypothetical protein